MFKSAFTLIEVLIVTAIIGILAVVLTTSILHQRDKATNARIKGDLSRLKTAFEDYYNDHNCYPPTDWFDDASDCGSNALSPYLSAIPCSPRSSEPYQLEKDGTNGCIWFKLYGELIDPANDPQAIAQYSASANASLGNYGVGSSNTTVSVNFPTPTPKASTAVNRYYCQGINNCSSIPANQNCSPAYSDPDCGGSPGDKCSTISTCTPK